MKDWTEQHHASILSGKEVYLGVDGECVKFSVVNDRVERQPIAHLNCNYPGADTVQDFVFI